MPSSELPHRQTTRPIIGAISNLSLGRYLQNEKSQQMDGIWPQKKQEENPELLQYLKIHLNRPWHVCKRSGTTENVLHFKKGKYYLILTLQITEMWFMRCMQELG